MTYTGSIRCEGDTWDLASSVGATATMVAAARAMATRAANPLINDQFAEPLVRAVGVDVLTRLASGELTASDIDDPERPNASMVRMAEHHAVRTKFFDEFFMDATRAGIRQVVILASGLDSRAYRLAWPAQTVVYEIDQPQVMEFKTRTLAELGATPTADRRVVTADLRADWPTALGAAGFDPTQPTAWSAEGLLRYLPPEAQDRLLDNVTALSVPDSRFATESIRNFKPHHEERMRERMTILANRWRAYGFDLDMNELVYFGDRNEPASYLSDNGWLLTETAPTAWLAEGMLIYLPPDPRTGCSTTAPNSVLRAARSLPNLSRALWISTQAGYEKWRIRFASTAWTSTWRRWCIPANAATSSTTCAPRAGTLRAQCGPTYSGAMVCPFPPHTTTIRSAKSSSSAVV